MCDCQKFSLANKKTGQARKNKSLKLMDGAIAELKESGIKPTIGLVAKILGGRLGITTVKKYWRLVNPKSAIDATASPLIANECKHTKVQLSQSNALLINAESNKSMSVSTENYVELYVKEWDLKILKPKYFEIISNGNKNLAMALYQRQFRRVPFYSY